MSMSQALRFPNAAMCPAGRALPEISPAGEYKALFGAMSLLLAAGTALALHGLSLIAY